MLTAVRSNRQTGVTLVESLVAMLVLSLGVGALAWTQARQLADGRHTTARAMAVLLTQDLGNRVLFNRGAATNGLYALAWGEQPAAASCLDTDCSAAMLARADLSAWRSALAQTLPAGDAHVFPAGDHTRRLGIAISWSFGASSDASIQAPLAVDAASHGVDCPSDRNCHVTYVPF
ncbi:type IV pilus modification protein PilV [Pseudorhodoferax sp.]|uniref:type IV pilus modification protein PilV n=1 Tax=Pseudorhodoferax sp. TaxID=1993553 RepID=UPI002DD61BC5|nr:type IV pilus modification protein PilV [Pseudorhodoferax sp.]